MAGDSDPLLDDSLTFFKLLSDNMVDTKMLLYTGLSHGFMNLAAILPECKPAVTDSIEELKILLGRKKE